MEYLTYYHSPIGTIAIAACEEGIVYCNFIDDPHQQVDTTNFPLLSACLEQLAAFFAGQLRDFSIPLVPQGSPFRQRVWRALQTIPYGQVASYSDIACAIGQPKAVRAVGQANHHNPIAILIPCHRVIGKNGDLTGYSAGIFRKQWLLAHELRFN
jgi:methylated-DNA-[protein]-cysteine S-methyltransferase